MKRLSRQPKSVVIAIALALGVAAVAGCSNGYDNTPNASATPDNMAAGNADSTQPVSDTWITTKVKAKLASMNGVDNSALHVETNNGVVTLTGTAASQASVDSMVTAVMGIKGVSRVDTSALHTGMATDNGANDNGMSAGTGDSQHPVTDTWITTKVKAKLQTVDGLDNSDLGIETNNGEVTMSGRVASQALLDAAVTATKSIEGVKDVNTSRVKIGPDHSD